MTTPSIPPAPESPVTVPKKGLPVLAWIGIGCGGLVVLLVIGLIIIGVLFGKMASEIYTEMDKNPAKAAAMMMAKLDSDIEVVGSDDEAKTVTIKVRSTGETTTLSMADLESGKFPGKKPESSEPVTNPTEN